MVRLVALAILLALGAGVFAFIQMSNVKAAEMQLAATQAELQTWKTRLTQYQSEGKTVASNLEQCNAQKAEIQTALDAANAAMTAKRPAAKR
jgi:hypothetical protein